MPDRDWSLYTRVLPDGRVIDVAPLMMGRARLVISKSLEAREWIDGW